MAKKAKARRAAKGRKLAAKTVKLNLAGLQQMMLDYMDALNSTAVRKKKAGGNYVAVDEAARLAAVKALDSAALSVSSVCEQGILAIEIEP